MMSSYEIVVDGGDLVKSEHSPSFFLRRPGTGREGEDCGDHLGSDVT